MSSAAFLKMLEAYRDTIGAAYPRQDVAAVIRVLRECAAHKVTTQDQICQATGLTASNVNKIVNGACERGWIHREASRRADGTKRLSLVAKGRKTLEDFESRCAEASSGSRTTSKTSGTKKSRQRLAEEARAQSGNLMDLVHETKALDKSGGIG